MYYQDRLSGRGFSRALSAASADAGGDVEVRAPRPRRAPRHSRRADRSRRRVAMLTDRIQRVERHHGAAGAPGRACCCASRSAVWPALMLRTNLSTRPVLQRPPWCGRSSRLFVLVVVAVTRLQRHPTCPPARRPSARWARTRPRPKPVPRVCGQAAVLVGRIDAAGTRDRSRRGQQANALIGPAHVLVDLAAGAVRERCCRTTSASRQCSRGSNETAPSSSGLAVRARRVEDLDAFIEAPRVARARSENVAARSRSRPTTTA